MKQIVSRGHSRPLTEISFVHDGPSKTLLVSAAHDKQPQIRDGETGDWIGTFHGHKGAVWSTKVDKLTRTLAITASGDFTAKLWSVSTGKELFELKHKHVVKTADFSPNSEKIATGCQDGLMRVYDTCQPGAPPQLYQITTNGNAESASKLLWSPTENGIVILGKKNGVIEKWDTRTGSSSAVLSVVAPSGGENIMDLEISTNHGLILVATGKQVCSYSLDSLSLLKNFTMPSPLTFKEEGGASLSPDGSTFLAGGSDLWVREFSYSSGEVLRTMKGHHGPVRCMRYHPSGLIGASGSEDGTIRMWHLAEGGNN